MSIQNVPLIISFDKWVKGLPAEHRSKAYEFAKSFLCVGAMHGAFVGVHAGLASISGSFPKSGDVPEKSKRDDQEKFTAYLSKKAKENKI